MAIFKCEIEVEEFKKAFDGIHSLQVEPLIKIREDGIHMEEVDKSCCTYMNIHIPKKSFQKFVYNEDMDITIDGILFSKALRTIRGTLLLGTDGDVIKLKEMGTNKTYELRLLENISRDMPKNPIPEKKFSVEIPTETLREMIAGAEKLYSSGDYNQKVIFAVNDGVIFKTETHDGAAKFIYKINTEKHEEKFSVAYDLQYIKSVVLSLTGEIATVSFYENYPLLIEFEGETTKGRFILAPIVKGGD